MKPAIAFLLWSAAAPALLLAQAVVSPPTPAAPAPLPPEIQKAIDARKAELARQPAGAPPAGMAVAMPPSISITRLPGDITLSVQSVTENRSSSGTGGLNLGFTMTSPNFPSPAIVRQVNVMSAVDDQDRSLVNLGRAPVGAMPPSAMTSRLISAARGMVPLTGTVNLRSSARDAKAIKLLEAEAELYAPNLENGGVVQIKNVKAIAGKPVENEILRKHGIELVVSSPDAHAALAATFGAPSAGPPPDLVMTVGVFVRDPQSKLAGMLIQDAAGTLIQNPGVSMAGALQTLRLTQALPEGAQIAIYLTVPEAIRTIPVRLENIAIP